MHLRICIVGYKNPIKTLWTNTRHNPRNCIMFCWANVVRKGQSSLYTIMVQKHFSYLSGNLHFEDYATQTV